MATSTLTQLLHSVSYFDLPLFVSVTGLSIFLGGSNLNRFDCLVSKCVSLTLFRSVCLFVYLLFTLFSVVFIVVVC